jgi:hypothetical protein
MLLLLLLMLVIMRRADRAPEMTISELQRECGESRKEKQILLQVTLVLNYDDFSLNLG